MVSGSGNFLFHCILLFWIISAFFLSFFISRFTKNKETVTAFPFGFMAFIHLIFLIVLVFVEYPSTKLPPFEYALIAIDSLLFVLAWKTYLNEKKNAFMLTFIILLIVVLGIFSIFFWKNSNLPYFSDIHSRSFWHIPQMWVLILAFVLIISAFSSFKKDMPIYLMIFASFLGGGLILHIVLNDWIAQTNYSPFLRIAMLFAYPLLLAYPFAQLAWISKQNKEEADIEKKNRVYEAGIQVKEDSIINQRSMGKTQPSQSNPSDFANAQTVPNQVADSFSIVDFLDEFIDEKSEEFKSKNVEIEAFYQGLNFQVAQDRAEFKAAFQSFFSFLEIICDRDYQVNIALGNISDLNIVQIDIIAPPILIQELDEQLFIAGQRFDELQIQNEYAIEDENMIRMQIVL
jgi:hypothetical protein